MCLDDHSRQPADHPNPGTDRQMRAWAQRDGDLWAGPGPLWLMGGVRDCDGGGGGLTISLDAALPEAWGSRGMCWAQAQRARRAARAVRQRGGQQARQGRQPQQQRSCADRAGAPHRASGSGRTAQPRSRAVGSGPMPWRFPGCRRGRGGLDVATRAGRGSGIPGCSGQSGWLLLAPSGSTGVF